MPITTVYRVEHPATGAGPYNPDNMAISAALEEMYLQHYDAAHPGPFADGISYDLREAHRFGFESGDQLRQWFDGWLDTLACQGFQVATYAVDADRDEDALLRGRSQVAFLPGSAEKLALESLEIFVSRLA